MSLSVAARSLLVAAGLAVLAGCAPSYGHYHYGHRHRHVHVSSSGSAVAVGLIAGVAITSMAYEASRPPPPRAVYVYHAPPPVVYVTPTAPPAPTRPTDELPSLNPTTTRAAFANVDVSSCNAPSGIYGHAKVSLNPDGRVSRVVVEDPADLDPATAKCIGDQIGRVTVPPFRGGMVVLGTTFRVQ